MTADYVVIDLEMTGLHVKTDRILEVGAARVRNHKVTECFSELINPGISLSEKVRKLTGISDEMAKEGGEQDEVLKAFLEFLGTDVLIGQNIIFDYSFLKQWAVNHKIPFEKKALDTLKLARKFLPVEQKKDLESLCCYFGIERVRAHRALDDALETQKIYELFLDCYSDATPEAFTPYPLLYQAKRQTPATSRQMQYLKQLTAFHGIPMPELSPAVTRSEVSRLTDELIRKYGKIRQN